MSNRIQLNTEYSEEHFINVGFKLEKEIQDYLRSEFSCAKAIFIIDQNVYELYQKTYISNLESVFDKVILNVVPSGEPSKSIDQYSRILDNTLAAGIERSTPVLVIGGGVTGDLGGFIAASCLRGLPLIHIPTTLLAMVDSSIGGKTGINHQVGKNLIGAFYQPKAVFSDLQFLETLPHRELINGLGEVIKYGMISNRTILDLLKEIPVDEEFSYSEKWEQLISICARIKVDIVSKDFKESGLREILNFGHTFAHVIEKVGNYKSCSHGEAVYMGMWGAVKLSKLLGFNIDISNLSEFRSLYTSTFNPSESVKELSSLMLHDKKVKDGAIRVIILEEIEKAKSTEVSDISLVESSWNFLIQEFN